jgi:threonine dehydrogenase-like Zn-dependent dehydrogenase
MVVAGLTGHADMPFPIDDLVVGDQTVVGTVGSPGIWPEVLRLIARGAVSPSRIISNIFKLDNADAAYGLLAARKPETGKVLVRSNL